MITLLLPTRNRFQDCSNTINSFFENCKNKENLQIILRCDNDDYEFIKNINNLPYLNRLKIIIGDRYSGYEDLHLFYNEMLKLAKGDFIIPINDDLICSTKDYDELILSKPKDKIKIYIGKSNGRFQGWYFPIINKKITDELGYLSKCNLYDGYLLQTLQPLDMYEEINFQCHHKKINDQVTIEKDLFIKEISSKNTKHLDTFKKDMDLDRERIRKIL